MTARQPDRAERPRPDQGGCERSPRRRLSPVGLAHAITGDAAAGPSVQPSDTEHPSVDAVVALAGSSGDRLRTAVSLMENGVAPVLVVSQAYNLNRNEAERLRRSVPSFRVIWARPRPENTRGEARMIRNLADEHGWRRIAIVTSKYHLVRARLLIERCVRQEVVMIASDPRESMFEAVRHWVHECGGLIDAVVLHRSG